MKHSLDILLVLVFTGLVVSLYFEPEEQQQRFNDPSLNATLYTSLKRSVTKRGTHGANFKELQDSISRSPLMSMPLKAQYHQMNDLGASEQLLLSGIHAQCSLRVTSVLQKALRGESLRISVIGGSNSAGGGMMNKKDIFYRAFVSWWNHVIKPKTGSLLELSVMALGGTGSDYFSFCLKNHFLCGGIACPDVVLVELSVNDYGTRYGAVAKPLEQLTRLLLALPSKPAILFVNLVDNIRKDEIANKISNPLCLNMEDLGQTSIAKHYGITSFSWRDVVCPLTNGRRVIQIHKGMLNKDKAHIGKKSHAQIAYMMISFFQTSFKTILQGNESLDDCTVDISELETEPIFLNSSELLHNQECWTYITPQFNNNVVSQTMKIKTLQKRGFHFIQPHNEKAYKYVRVNTDRSDAFGGWSTKTGGSLLKVRLWVSSDGYKKHNWTALKIKQPVILPKRQYPNESIQRLFHHRFTKSTNTKTSSVIPSSAESKHDALSYNAGHRSDETAHAQDLKSVGVILRSSFIGANATIWIDESREKALHVNAVNRGPHLTQTRLYWVASGVTPGEHNITVITSDNGIFNVAGFVTVSGNFSGYPYYRPFDGAKKVWKL